MQSDVDRNPVIRIRTMTRDDYPVALSIMNEMWPQFNFGENDLIKKENEHGNKLVRFLATVADDPIAFCNLYLSEMKPECHLSIFYTKHEAMTLALNTLLEHIVHITRDNRLTITSRISEDDSVLSSVLKRYGFHALSAESDFIFNNSNLDSYTSVSADMDMTTLSNIRDNTNLLKQLYELEISALSLTRDVSWLSLELFTLSLFSMKNLISDKSIVVICNGEVVGYSMAILTDDLEYKIRKVRVKPSEVNDSLVRDLISSNLYLLKQSGVNKIWLSMHKNEVELARVASNLGFALTYTWVLMIKQHSQLDLN